MYLHMCVYIYTHTGAQNLGALEILKTQFTTALPVLNARKLTLEKLTWCAGNSHKSANYYI